MVPKGFLGCLSSNTGNLSRGSEFFAGQIGSKSMAKPKVARINNGNRGTYGGGARFTPGDQASARSGNQAALKKLVTPAANPTAAVIGEVNKMTEWQSLMAEDMGEVYHPSTHGSGFGDEPFEQPRGNFDRYYKAIKGHAEKQGTRISNDPLVAGKLFVDSLLNDPDMPAMGAGVALPPDYAKRYGVDIVLNPQDGDSSFSKFDTLVHELGHKRAGHVDPSSPAFGIAAGAAETEAQTIAYGVQNRIYPWQKQPTKIAAQYALDSQQQYSDQAVDPAAHLGQKSVQTRINSAIESIAPGARKPFRAMVPDIFGGPAPAKAAGQQTINVTATPVVEPRAYMKAAAVKPAPAPARIMLGNQDTYGRGVRFTPGDQRAARSANQAELKAKITPSADPVGQVAAEIQNPSGKAGFLPQGSEKAYQWLKGRTESAAIGEKAGYQGGRPLRVGDGPEAQAYIDMWARGGETNGLALHPRQQKGLGANMDIALASNRPPYERASTLAHELGHTLLRHTDLDVYDNTPFTIAETGAETVSYGAMNRLYPWNKKGLANTAQYSTAMADRWGDGDPVAYLSDPAEKAKLNQAITDIVPNPRQPFKSITPGVYGQPPAPAATPSNPRVAQTRAAIARHTQIAQALTASESLYDGVLGGLDLKGQQKFNQAYESFNAASSPGRRNAAALQLGKTFEQGRQNIPSIGGDPYAQKAREAYGKLDQLTGHQRDFMGELKQGFPEFMQTAQPKFRVDVPGQGKIEISRSFNAGKPVVTVDNIVTQGGSLPRGSGSAAIDYILQNNPHTTKVGNVLNEEFGGRLAKKGFQPVKTGMSLDYVYGGQPPAPAPSADVVSSGFRLKQQTLTPRDVATGAPRSSAVVRDGVFEDSFRVNQPARAGAGNMTLSSDRNLNQALTTTGIAGDSSGLGLSGKLKQNVTRSESPDTTVTTYNPNAPTTKPTKLTEQAGDRLFSPSERARLNQRGEYVGLGSSNTPVKSQNPAMVKLGALVDNVKKGFWTPDQFRAEVQRSGLQSKFDSVKQLGQTLFGSRGGGEVYSGTMQQGARLSGNNPQAVKLPQSTEVLGEAGLSLDSFRINQPPRVGAPASAPSRNLEFNIALNKAPAGGFAGDSGSAKLSPMTKALGYEIKGPSQTGLPWQVAADPKTGEMLTLQGKPLPPLVGPSFPTNPDTPAPVQVGQRAEGRRQKGAFKEGFAVSAGTEATQKQSFFKRTPEQTAGMGLGDRLKFAAGRAAGDIASDASRNQYWRYNHPLAVAGAGFEKLAGGNKVGGAAASFAGIQALGQTSNQFDLLNPGQAFRPKGMSAAYPVSDTDKTKIAPGVGGYAKELLGRYVFGRNGNLLPFDQFSKERPDVNQADYKRYSQYLKGGGANGPMPAGTIDVGGFGVLKANANGINGPEARLAGFSVTPLGAAAGTATATGVASIWNKGLRGPAMKGLGVVGTALDFSNRRREGQGVEQAAKQTAVSSSAALATGQYGAVLGARLGPVGAVAGAIVGGVVGGVAGDSAVKAVDAKAEQIRAVQASGKADPISKFLAATPIGRLAMRALPGRKEAEKPAADQAMSNATDRLLKASANFKLVKQKDGSVKSVPNDTGSNVRGEVVKVSDGDSYELRTYDPKTKQFQTNNTRLAGADTRETADHDSDPSAGFFNRMIGKQIKDQGFADKNAVFAQGEKDKQAAAKLLPVGSMAYQTATGDSTHGRPVADVSSEGGKDVAAKLIESGNAQKFEKDKKGGISDATREKIAQMQYGKAGQGDRKITSQEKIATEGNKTKLAGIKLQNDGRLQNTDLDGRYKIANTQEQNKGKLQNTDLEGRYKIAGIGLQNQGKLQVADLTSGRRLQGTTYTADRKLQGTVYTADTKLQGTTYTADRKLQGDAYKADRGYAGKLDSAKITGGLKIAQEGVKQSGAANVATIRAGGQVGAARANADGKAYGADRVLEGTRYKADATVRVAAIKSSEAESKATSEGSKALASYMSNMNRDRARAESDSEKNRVAKLRSLGVY